MTGRQRLVLTALALVFGAAVRIAFLEVKPFWRDEAWVVRVAESPLRIAIDYDAPVPAGFLLAVKASTFLPGPPEVTRRLLPLLAGLATLALLPLLARRLGADSLLEVTVLWLAAGLPALVYYSREVKPYGLDAFLSTLLALLTVSVTGSSSTERPGARWWVALAVVLALVPWLSFGALFAAAAMLAWAVVWPRPGKRLLPWAAVIAALALTVGLAYVLVIRGQLANRSVMTWWGGDLAVYRARPVPLSALAAVGQAHAALITYLFPGAWLLGAAAVVVGVMSWPRRGRMALAWLWLASALLAGAAAALEMYVTSLGRFLLFLAPAVVLLAAAGLLRLASWLTSGRAPGLGLGVAMAASLVWGGQALWHRRPTARADPSRNFLFDVIVDVAPLIDRLEREPPGPAAVIVSRFAVEPFRYYARGRLAGARYVHGSDFGGAVSQWRPALEGEGWVVIAEEELQSPRREALIEMGLTVEEVAATRGARLWRVREPRPPASPPRTR